MNVIEFIGFIISILAFFFVFFKRMYDQWRLRKYPDEVAKEQQGERDRLKDFLRSLDADMDEDDEEDEEEERFYNPPPPPPQQQPRPRPALQKVGELENRTFTTKVESRKLSTSVETRKLSTSIEERYSGKGVVSQYYQTYETDTYHEKKEATPSRASGLLSTLKSKKDMIILNEILSKPLSQRR